MGDPKDRSIAELLPDLGDEVMRLVRSEAELMRSEMNDKLGQLESAMGTLAAGGICLFAALLILLQAVIVALTNAGMGADWASLLVGAVAAIVGGALLYYGSSSMSLRNLTPRKTLDEARKAAQMTRDHTR